MCLVMQPHKHIPMATMARDLIQQFAATIKDGNGTSHLIVKYPAICTVRITRCVSIAATASQSETRLSLCGHLKTASIN